MTYHTYYLSEKYEDNPGVWVYRFQTHESSTIFPFLPGQYVFIKNPNYKPEEEHPFSIASTPTDMEHLEFCIKVCGDWTEEFAKLQVGNLVKISEPQGIFIWDPQASYPVFLLGGIGISPIMSMLRYAQETDYHHPILVLYGNRTENSVTYLRELDEMIRTDLHLTIIHILSHILDDHPWKGYRGFITKEIIEQEVDFQKHPTFFIIGPPVFTDLMQKILSDFDLDKHHIRIENLEEKTKSFIDQSPT